jgi:DNA invertase Pin-like site-specific DNA recombinase
MSLPQNPSLSAFRVDVEPSTQRAALLTRLSQFQDNSTSLERQRQDGAARIAAGGWSFDPALDVFEDVESGWDPAARRRGLERFFANLERYDIVVFWKLDRAFRSIPSFVDFLCRCERAGVGLVSVKEDIDTTTPVGRLVAYNLMAIAEMESSNISMRVRSANEFLARCGARRGGPAPFGFRVEVIGHEGTRPIRRLGLHPEQAPALRMAVDAVLRGCSINEATRTLNAHPAVDRERSPNGVRLLLRNPVLIGRLVHRGQVVVDDNGVPLAPNEPLLDDWTWTRLQRAIDSRSRWNGEVRSRRDSLLRGLIKCGTCGASMGGSLAYSCAKLLRNPDRCGGNAISRPSIEALVVEQLFSRLTPEVVSEAQLLLERERTSVREPDPAEVRMVELRHALDVLEADRLAGLYASSEGTRRFRAQHHQLLGQIEVLHARARAVGSAAIPDFRRLGSIPLADAWARLEPVEHRTILQSTIERVVVHPPVLPPGKRGTGRKFNPARVEILWKDNIPEAQSINRSSATEIILGSPPHFVESELERNGQLDRHVDVLVG